MMGLEDWIAFDQQLLLRLNGSDSLFWDNLMEGITSTVAWLPVGVVLLYLVVKNNTMREAGLVILFFALTIVVADQFSSSFCKPYFARFRPTQDPLLMYLVDVVDGYRGGRYGFISSHAANTFGVCMFLSLLLRNRWMTFSLVLWAALCSYSPRRHLLRHVVGIGVGGFVLWVVCLFASEDGARGKADGFHAIYVQRLCRGRFGCVPGRALPDLRRVGHTRCGGLIQLASSSLCVFWYAVGGMPNSSLKFEVKCFRSENPKAVAISLMLRSWVSTIFRA